jgi:hypothetical protein
MTHEPDYYAILGVAPGSEDIVIQAAYRALMRRYHPDKNPSKEAQRKTVEINAAYAILGDANQRAAYDARRTAEAARASSSKTEQSSTPPPPPPPPGGNASYAGKSAVAASGTGNRGGLIFASILTVCIVGGLVLSASNSSDVANNTMNVDENLTTTDMNATDMNASAIDVNAVDANLTVVEPADLSKQPQTALSYDTIEAAANRVAKMITTKGISGARAYSEKCHKAVQASPSWNGADDCAAFDYAAAYIDDAVSTQAGWPKNGYFEFQNTNEPDDYAAVGAPTYVTSDRLSKIRAAAQSAAADAFRYEVARMKASEPPPPPSAPPTPTTNSSD